MYIFIYKWIFSGYFKYVYCSRTFEPFAYLPKKRKKCFQPFMLMRAEFFHFNGSKIFTVIWKSLRTNFGEYTSYSDRNRWGGVEFLAFPKCVSILTGFLGLKSVRIDLRYGLKFFIFALKNFKCLSQIQQWHKNIDKHKQG